MKKMKSFFTACMWGIVRGVCAFFAPFVAFFLAFSMRLSVARRRGVFARFDRPAGLTLAGRAGFSLAELIMGIVIIGVLAAAVSYLLLGGRDAAEESVGARFATVTTQMFTDARSSGAGGLPATPTADAAGAAAIITALQGGVQVVPFVGARPIRWELGNVPAPWAVANFTWDGERILFVP